jgi:hypothetical protein
MALCASQVAIGHLGQGTLVTPAHMENDPQLHLQLQCPLRLTASTPFQVRMRSLRQPLAAATHRMAPKLGVQHELGAGLGLTGTELFRCLIACCSRSSALLACKIDILDLCYVAHATLLSPLLVLLGCACCWDPTRTED